MTDRFALLNQPRRPWLEPDRLEKAFLEGASTLHPDRFNDAPQADQRAAQEQYSALNEAHQCLKRSRTRLRHLLELERGSRIPDLQEIPPDWMALFTEIGALCQSADHLVRERAATSSPILQVALLERSENLRERLQAMQTRLKERDSALETSLRRLDERWSHRHEAAATGGSGLLRDLEELYRLFSFNDRWMEQIQARQMQLMA